MVGADNVRWTDSSTALLIAGGFAFGALVISCANIYQHLQSFTDPSKQKCLIRIILIVPIYSLSSFLSIVDPKSILYFETIRDVYEAYAIYIFLVLLINVCGSDSQCASDLRDKGSMTHPFPCCCLDELELGQDFLRICKQACLQFVLVKPVFAIISLILLSQDDYENSVYQWILSATYNISYTVALCGLFYFYLSVRDMISWFYPVFKFLAVKLVVFATYYQSLVTNFWAEWQVRT